MKTKLLVLFLASLVLFVGNNAIAQTVEVTIPAMFDTTGAKIYVPIMVSDVTGLEIYSFSFTLVFDAAVLNADDYSATGTLTDGWSAFSAKKTGEITIAAASAIALKGAGELVYVKFDVIGDVGTQSTLALSQFVLNEGSPAANTKGGSFSVPKVTHGPVCGAVTATAARFVIRTDFFSHTQIFLSQDSTNWTNPIRSEIFSCQEVNENFALLDVHNLTPNTTYFYTVHLGGQQQPGFIGKFKTFPAEGATANLKIIFGSCQQAYYDDPKSGFGNIFPLMAQEQADIFLHQGDWIYPDTTDSEQGDSLNFFAKHIDLIYENYRDRYDPFFPMAEMLKVTPVDFVWDDHDWVNNNCDGTFMNEGGANSIAIYQKAFPHYPLPSASNGIWHKFTCGNADVFMVDNRAQRDPNLNALKWIPAENRWKFVANSTDNHSILGDEQMTWLLDELKNSKATWKFISSGTPFNPAVRGLIELALLLQGTGYDPIPDPATGNPMSMAFLAEEFSDKWAGFPSDVYKLLSGIISNDIKNVIFLSGDTHNSGIDDGANSVLPELMGGPLDRTNQQVVAMSKALFKVDIWNKGGHTYDNAMPPDLGNAYGKVSVFGADSVKLEVVSETGNTLAMHTVKSGFAPRKVAGLVVPGAIDFGTIMSDKMGGSAVVAIATSIDTFKISDIEVTILKGKSIIVPSVKTVTLASGAAEIIQFEFIPQLPEGIKIDTTLVKITFQCNDVTGEKAIYAQGVAQLTGVETADQPSIPADYNLYSCYPNPFNASTTIRFAVPKLSQVEIVVYNSLGQIVRRLAKGDYPAGNHRLEWNGSNDLNELVGSGLYFILFKTQESQQINKTLFLK